MTEIDRIREQYRRGAFADAVHPLRELVAAGSCDPEGLLLLGNCLIRTKQIQEAAEVFERLLAAQPDSYDALTWLAIVKKTREGIDQALAYAQRAVSINPGGAEGFSVLGGCYLYLRQPEPALAAFEAAAKLDPQVAEHQHNLALAYLMMHKHAEGVEHLAKAVELAPNNEQSYLVLAREYSLYGFVGIALEWLAKGLARMPNSAALHAAAGGCCTLIRRDEEAEVHYRKAVALAPSANSAFAGWLVNQGRFEEAAAIFEKMLDLEPGQAFYGLMQCRSARQLKPQLLQKMEERAQMSSLSPFGEMQMRYALGRAHEQLGRYEEAMSDFDVANDLAYRIHHSGHPVEIEQFVQEDDQVISCFETLPENGSGSDSEEPLFIVGMIRSGTTLLDQIVSSHPSISSAGELRFWTEESLRLASNPASADLESLASRYLEYIELLAGKSERITDKMPLNFAYIGIIHRTFRNARFLHIKRNPIDTCLSIYMTYFGAGVPFAYRRENIVGYYREYQRVMDYWRRAIPSNRLLSISYEDLIARPEEIIPKVIDFCGLPWNEACLHHERNASSINTPSRWQARQTIYKTSVEKWRKYEPWLGVFSALKS